MVCASVQRVEQFAESFGRVFRKFRQGETCPAIESWRALRKRFLKIVRSPFIKSAALGDAGENICGDAFRRHETRRIEILKFPATN